MRWFINIWESIRKFRFKSYFLRNIVFITLSVLLPIVTVLAVTYSASRHITSNEIQGFNNDTLQAVVKNVQSYLNNSHVVCAYLFSQSKDLIALENNVFTLSSDQIELGRTLTEKIDTFSAAIRFQEAITILDNRNQSYYASSGEFGSYIDKPDFFLVQNPLSQEGRWTIVFENTKSPILAYTQTNQNFSVVIEIPEDSIRPLIGNLIAEPYALQIESLAGNLVYQTANFNTYAGYDGANHVSSECLDEDIGLRYTLMRPITSYNASNSLLRTVLFVLALVSGVLVILVSIVITVRIFQPIGYLTRIIQSSSSYPEWQDDHTQGVINEIQYIAQNIESLESYNQVMEDELQQKVADLKTAQSQVLQSQIDSHFLFNALENINWEAMFLTGGINKVSKMVETLAGLLRLGLESNQSMIPLRDEIEHIRLYFEMQRYRFADKFTIYWDVDEALLHQLVLKLSLQPVVENIFTHVIKNANRPIHIVFRCYRKDEFIYVLVEDDGDGLLPDDLAKLRSKISALDKDQNRHIGLVNIAHRLHILYGISDGIIVESEYGEYTKVYVKYRAQGN